MSKYYLHGQTLIVLQGICLIYIHRNDFYRKTKEKLKQKILSICVTQQCMIVLVIMIVLSCNTGSEVLYDIV